MLYTKTIVSQLYFNFKKNSISLNPHNSPLESGSERLNGLLKITKQLVRPCWEKIEWKIKDNTQCQFLE